MPQPIQQLQTGEIVSRGRIFERPLQDGIHYYQTVIVLDRYAQGLTNGHEGMIPITHKVEVEVPPPQDPNSY